MQYNSQVVLYEAYESIAAWVHVVMWRHVVMTLVFHCKIPLSSLTTTGTDQPLVIVVWPVIYAAILPSRHCHCGFHSLDDDLKLWWTGFKVETWMVAHVTTFCQTVLPNSLGVPLCIFLILFISHSDVPRKFRVPGVFSRNENSHCQKSWKYCFLAMFLKPF
jgi:hypothetical protein